jgi:branched-chain amino acid transport system permease protein
MQHYSFDTSERRHQVLIWAGYALLMLLAPLLWRSSSGQGVLSQMGIAIIACLSYNILLGQGGMLSFGHAVYSGMGAFLGMHTLNAVSGGLPLPVSLIPLLSGIASMALAVLLGWVSTRKAGTPYAMITLGVGELVWAASLTLPSFFGGEGGVTGNRVAGGKTLGISLGPQIELYYLIAAYCLVCTALMYAFTRTPLGRMLNAVRDNAQRAEFIGLDAHWVRYLAFVIAAFFAGIAGALAALNFEIVSSEVLSSQRSGAYLVFTILGGSGYFFGPIVGGILMVLALVLLSGYTQAWALYLGLIFMAAVIYLPGGLASFIVLHLRLIRSGAWRQLCLPYLKLSLTAAMSLLGAAAMIEMLYQLQLGTALGHQLEFLGLPLDAHAMTSWLGAASLMASGVALLVISRRSFLPQWQHLLAGLALPAELRDGP